MTQSDRRKETRIFLKLLHNQSDYSRVPVRWLVKRTGERMQVRGSEGGTIVIQLNVKGVPIGELIERVNNGLRYANEIHRGLTKASVIGENHSKHEGRKYVPSEEEELERFKKVVLEDWDQIFERSYRA